MFCRRLFCSELSFPGFVLSSTNSTKDMYFVKNVICEGLDHIWIWPSLVNQVEFVPNSRGKSASEAQRMLKKSSENQL